MILSFSSSMIREACQCTLYLGCTRCSTVVIIQFFMSLIEDRDKYYICNILGNCACPFLIPHILTLLVMPYVFEKLRLESLCNQVKAFL